MQLSQRGLDFIKQWEGYRDKPYDDGYGNLTIGYGHLIKPGERFTQITRAQAEEILAQDTSYYQNQVNSLVRVPLTQSQFDALVSLAFNWHGFPESRLLQYLNAGDYAAAAQRLGEHPVTASGRFSQGLQNRRTAEKALFLSDGGASLPDNSLPDSSYPDIAFDDGLIPDYSDPLNNALSGKNSTALLIGAGVLLVLIVAYYD